MGMAATQARLISLKARMSNVEYQGQQINQERTILSQQATDLYTSLLAMSVPTPPSTQDFATITYKGVDGNTTLTIGNVKPHDKKFVVEIQQESYGNAIVSDYGSLPVKEATDEVKATQITQVPTGAINQADLANYYVKNGNTVIQLSANMTDLETYVTVTPETDSKTGVTTKKYTFKPSVISSTSSLWVYDPTSQNTISNPSKNVSPYYIGSTQAYEFDTARQMFPDMFNWDNYEQAIRNTYGTQAGAITKDDFYVFIQRSDTGIYSLKFALKSDVTSPDGFAKTYSFTSNGKYTKSEEIDQCELEFDAHGRIQKIGIPSFDETNPKEITSYRYLDLTAETDYDEKAYQDAYAQYEYKMYEYDKKNQEINAKTEIIQQEDKNLELKLTRLDNERKALQNEIDACDKVISDNIEKSFKTFSG